MGLLKTSGGKPYDCRDAWGRKCRRTEAWTLLGCGGNDDEAFVEDYSEGAKLACQQLNTTVWFISVLTFSSSRGVLTCRVEEDTEASRKEPKFHLYYRTQSRFVNDIMSWGRLDISIESLRCFDLVCMSNCCCHASRFGTSWAYETPTLKVIPARLIEFKASTMLMFSILENCLLESCE